MMKKISDCILRCSMILLFAFGYLFAPLNVEAAIKAGDTLAGLRQQLKELKQKKADQQNKKKLTQNEINNLKSASEKAFNEIVKAQNEVAAVTKTIDQTNAQIASVKDESEQTLVLYQKLLSDNIYMSYITGASTMTELIMRNDMVNLITSRNDQQLRELELLIDKNDNLSKALKKYEENLEKKRVEYQNNVDKLTDDLQQIDESGVTIDEEIKSMQELIDYYAGIGCGENQDLTECVAIANNSGWLKPVSKGVITSLFGYRKAPTPTTGNNHSGVDIGVSEGTKVYGTAAGVVGAIVRKSSCGGNKVYIWTNVNGKKYTYAFLHLKEIKVSVGDKVTTDTLIALSGGRSYGYDTCTTGPHLHYGLAEGHHFGAAGDLALSKFNSYVINPPGYPGLGQWFYGRL